MLPAPVIPAEGGDRVRDRNGPLNNVLLSRSRRFANTSQATISPYTLARTTRGVVRFRPPSASVGLIRSASCVTSSGSGGKHHPGGSAKKAARAPSSPEAATKRQSRKHQRRLRTIRTAARDRVTLARHVEWRLAGAQPDSRSAVTRSGQRVIPKLTEITREKSSPLGPRDDENVNVHAAAPILSVRAPGPTRSGDVAAKAGKAHICPGIATHAAATSRVTTRSRPTRNENNRLLVAPIVGIEPEVAHDADVRTLFEPRHHFAYPVLWL